MAVHRAKGHRRWKAPAKEACEMQEAAVVLSILRERGRKGLPLTQLYRQMFSKDLYLLAYGSIYSEQGANAAGRKRENRRRQARGKDRQDHRADAARAVRVRPGPPHLHPEKER